MSAWSHLPNVAHIDRVIASVNKYPEIWAEAWAEAWEGASDAAWDVAWCAAHNVAHDEDWDAVQNAIDDTNRGAASHAAWDAISALIAYHDCEQYLNMTSEELKVWALLSERSAAVLLLPAVIAFEQIKKMEEC
jgi:hypothetical protein